MISPDYQVTSSFSPSYLDPHLIKKNSNSPYPFDTVRVLRRQVAMERHLGRSPARPLPVVAGPIVGPVASASRNAWRRFPRGAHPFQGGPLERDLRRYLSSEGHIFDVGAVYHESFDTLKQKSVSFIIHGHVRPLFTRGYVMSLSNR